MFKGLQMAESYFFSHSVACGYAIQMWPEQCDGQGCSGFLGMVSLLPTGIRSRKAAFLCCWMGL